MARDTTIAGVSGNQMAKAIIKTVDLMYQNNTAINYLRELIFTLQVERKARERVRELDKKEKG